MNDPILDAMHAGRQKAEADRLSRKLQRISREVEKLLRKQFGDSTTGFPLFSLFVYTDGVAQYVSNADRSDVKTIVASVLARWENTPALHVPMHEKTDEEFLKEKDDPL